MAHDELQANAEKLQAQVCLHASIMCYDNLIRCQYTPCASSGSIDLGPCDACCMLYVIMDQCWRRRSAKAGRADLLSLLPGSSGLLHVS